MGYNAIEIDGEVKLDLSGDTVTEDLLPQGVTAHNADGDPIKGKMPIVNAVNGKSGDVTLSAEDVGARPNTWMPSYSDVNADKAGTADSKVSAHNVSDVSHNDIRLLIQGLSERLNAIANSTDVDLDDFKEVVAYIKANRGLIDAITTNKINYTDIINDLVTNVTNKPLSAAQGVTLKALIDALQSGKLNASELSTAINTALAQAKASGKFDGAPGSQGIQGYNIVASVDRPSFTTAQWDTYGEIGHAENWGATSNAGARVGDIFLVVGTATDTGIGHMLVYKYTGEKGGNTLSGQCIAHHIVAYRGAKGNDGYTPVKGVDYFDGRNGNDGTNYVLTDADRNQIANIVTTMLGGQPVYGIVGEDKTVTLRGNIAFDEYTFGYIKNGEFVEIGKGEYVPDVETYTVKNSLVACKTSNEAITADSATPYIATITPVADPIKGGNYNLSAIYVKMGGVDVSATAVSGNTIKIDNVTGDIFISCVGYRNDSRVSGSTGKYSAQSGKELTGFIPVTYSSTLYLKNVTITTATTEVTSFYGANPVDNADQACITGCTFPTCKAFEATTGGAVSVQVSALNKKVPDDDMLTYKDQIAYVRISADVIGANSIITVDEPIV